MTIVVRDADATDEATLFGFLRDLQDAERALCASRRPGPRGNRLSGGLATREVYRPDKSAHPLLAASA